MTDASAANLFDSAEWYDRSINWDARLKRELPLLREVFGPPAAGGLLDAGCGPGRQVVALAREGYCITGLDRSAEMIAIGKQHAAEAGVDAAFVQADYANLAAAGANFDGILCLANSLAAAGSAEAVQSALGAMAAALRPGGHVVINVLNFAKMRTEHPAVRGPRIATHEGREYVSTRIYNFVGGSVEVTNVTLWKEGGAWKQFAGVGKPFAIESEALFAALKTANLTLEAAYANYARDPFDPMKSDDLVIVARR